MFVGDPLATINDTRAFKFISDICKAPDVNSSALRGSSTAIDLKLMFALNKLNTRFSFSTSMDYERRIRKLTDQVDQLNHEKTELVNHNVSLEGEIMKLKKGHSPCSGLIHRARKQNNNLLGM